MHLHVIELRPHSLLDARNQPACSRLRQNSDHHTELRSLSPSSAIWLGCTTLRARTIALALVCSGSPCVRVALAFLDLPPVLGHHKNGLLLLLQLREANIGLFSWPASPCISMAASVGVGLYLGVALDPSELMAVFKLSREGCTVVTAEL